MAARTGIVTRALPRTSVRRDYLELLQARDFGTFEDTVVERILGEVRKQPAEKILPVRLSAVAQKFLIRPSPQVIAGKHDGEIDFDAEAGLFVIKLCKEDASQPTSGPRTLARQRFTYAHEMAHRFCFIEESNRWVRAVDVATARLTPSAAMRERITINRIEEGVCNNIARRILIPEDFLVSKCHLNDWFRAGRECLPLILEAARSFGVSLDCLLVRLQKEVVSGRLRLAEPHCLIVVSPSRGTETRRGQMKLRISTAIIPCEIGPFNVKSIYPGIALEKFGAEVAELAESLFAMNSRRSGSIRHSIRLIGAKNRSDRSAEESFVLQGWWHLLGSNASKESSRMLLWGTLLPTGS